MLPARVSHAWRRTRWRVCRRIGSRQPARCRRSGGRGVIGRRCRWLWRTRSAPRGRRPTTIHPPLFSSHIIRLSSPIKNYNVISRFIQHIEAKTSVYERACGRVFLNRSDLLCGGETGGVRFTNAGVCHPCVRYPEMSSWRQILYSFLVHLVILTCSSTDWCSFKHAIAVAGLLRYYTVMSLSGFS